EGFNQGGDGRGTRADRGDGRPHRLRNRGGAWPANRACCPRSVRKIAGRRTGDLACVAAFRRRRRRHQARTAHRAHHAVPVLWWVVARGQLGACRVAAAHQQRREGSGADSRARDRRSPDAGDEAMNRPLRRVAAACLLLFALLLVNVNYLQVVKADEYKDNPLNRRSVLDEYARARGPILVGGRPIASSRETNGELKFLRGYSDGPMYAPATGFHSPTFGRSGIERQENDYLAGPADAFFAPRLIHLVTNKKPEGGSVSLTLDPRAQQAAWTAIQGKRGAVVALDPRT